MRIRAIIIFVTTLCTIHGTSLCRERQFIPYHLQPGSRLWIDGTATLGSFLCETVAVYGNGGLDAGLSGIREASLAHKADSSRVQVSVLVKMFDCGNPAMNSDMYSALRMDKNSSIQYTLTNVQVLYDSTAQNGWLGLRTIGRLSIAGFTRMDTIDAQVKSLSNMKYEVLGKKELSMLDFNITPPTAFFGLIKANERLVVNFDLIAGPDHNFTERHDDIQTQKP